MISLPLSSSHIHLAIKARWLTLVLLIVMVASARMASAHAILVASVPPHGAALNDCPESIILRFNATLEPTLTRAYLVDMHQKRIPLETTGHAAIDKVVVPMPHLTAGVYTLVYTVLARDGHVTEGSVRFTILEH